MEQVIQKKNDFDTNSAIKGDNSPCTGKNDPTRDLETNCKTKNINEQENRSVCGCRNGCGQSSKQGDAQGQENNHGEGMKKHEKISLIIAGLFVALCLIAEHLLKNELLAMIFSGLAIVAGLIIVLPETTESIKARSIDINVLIIIAIIGAVYVQAYEEAAAVLFLFSVGEYLEGRALRKSNDAIKELAKLAPDTSLVIKEGKTLTIPTDQVLKGETIVVKPGMSVALDGTITRGSSSFNDAAVTGESIPVYKGVGDTVFAGSLALDGSCEIETTSTVADSTLAKIAQMVEEAQKQKSSREDFVQRFAKVYTPIVIVVALMIALLPSLVTLSGLAHIGTPETWIYRACELLVISCPCAFVISTPVTMVSALARAAKMGVLVKGGAFFEEGVRVRAAAFDKTGTLTEGRPVVVAVSQVAPNEGIIALAAALESHSTHPLGLAVLSYAEKQGIDFSDKVDMVRETAGKGLTGVIAGKKYAIGSAAFMREDLAFGENVDGLLDTVAEHSGTPLLVASIDTHALLLGAIVVSDAIREEAKPVVTTLHTFKQSMRTIMLTGDNTKVASSVADTVGIDEVHASLLPQDKTTELQKIQQSIGPVAYIGDGINDAPSLAAADVGIAMGGAGSAVALSSADVVLMADNLSALPKFFKLSTKTVRTLKQNIALAIGLKVLVALLVILGVAQMWMAVLADTGVSLLVILNGMRLLRIRL